MFVNPQRILFAAVSAVLFPVLSLMGGAPLPLQAQHVELKGADGAGPQVGQTVSVDDRDETGELSGVSGGAVSVGDVNGDGLPDLLITGNASSSRSRPSTTLYLNETGASFAVADVNLPDVTGSATAFGKVDGDDDLDLLLTGGSSDGRIASLYMGDGEGTFTKAGTTFEGVAGGSVTFGKLNRDEDLDLLVTGRNLSATGPGAEGNPTATVYLGNGGGGFTRARAGLDGVAKSSASLGDVDRDGHLDLLIAGRDASGSPKTMLYLGTVVGDFDVADTNLPDLAQGATLLHDLDNDRRLDVVITGLDADDEPSTYFYRGTDEGGFKEVSMGLPDVVDGSLSVGDVNADNYPDLLITGEKASGTPIAELYLGTENGGLSKAGAELTGVAFSASSIADVNDDGDLDLLITGMDKSGTPTSTLYLGDGAGGFSRAAEN